jgi:hypothetical protein
MCFRYVFCFRVVGVRSRAMFSLYDFIARFRYVLSMFDFRPRSRTMFSLYEFAISFADEIGDVLSMFDFRVCFHDTFAEYVINLQQTCPDLPHGLTSRSRAMNSMFDSGSRFDHVFSLGAFITHLYVAFSPCTFVILLYTWDFYTNSLNF